MTESISPFDIPHIVDLIGQYLSQKDYARCILVNKALHQQFRHLLWRCISKAPRGRTGRPIIPFNYDDQEALLASGSLIRKLKLQENRHGEIIRTLADPSSTCKNLLEFDCTTEENFACCNLLVPVMEVVEKNVALKKCTLSRFISSNTTEPLKRFYNILVHHSCLTMLKLLDTIEVHYTTYRCLLQHLPRTLESLTLLWHIRNQPEPEGFSEIEWPNVYPYLQSVSLSLTLRGYEGSTVIPFLQRCPNMQGFEFRYGRHSTFRDIAKLVSDPLQFPKLSRLTLGSMTLEDQECLPIVEGVKNRIKEFSAYSLVTARSLYPLYSGLATQWSDTLEVLRFQHSDVSSQQIRLLLTSCSKLKTFSVFTAFRGDDDLYAPDSTGLAVWSDNCAVDWVCLGLENLEMTFLDIRQVQDWQAPDTVIRLQESRTADGIKDVYRQLGRLTKLRYLRIGWSSTKHFEEKCNLNLSMGSGLRHLESLKDLRVLDVGCITRVNVGQLEVEWMVKNWPRIRTIKGLFIKEGRNHRGMMMPADDFEKVDEGFVSRILGLPDHIDWIRIQKPHILVS